MRNFLCLFLLLDTFLIQNVYSAPTNKTSDQLISPNPSTYYEWESKLRHDLTKTYDTRVIPLKELGKPIIVKVGLALNTLFKMCPETDKLSGNYFLRMEWEDERLKWDPTKYGGLKTSYSFDMNDIWIPDVTLYYGFSDIPGKISRGPYTMVNSDGKVTWVPQVTLKVHCQPILPTGNGKNEDEDHSKHHHHSLHMDGDEFANLNKDVKGGKDENVKNEKEEGKKKSRRSKESESEDSEDEEEEEEEDEKKKGKGKKDGKNKDGKKGGKKGKDESSCGNKGHQGCHHNKHGMSAHRFDNLIEHCDIKFGSWIYDTKALVLEPFAGDKGIDMTIMQYEHKKNGGDKNVKAKVVRANQDDKNESSLVILTPRHDMSWQVLENKVKTHQLKYPCCPEDYADITFHLKLKKLHEHLHKHQGEEDEKKVDADKLEAKTGESAKEENENTTKKS